MIPVSELTSHPMAAWPDPRLGYPLASVVVGAARDQDDRDTTGRDEDRAR
jgi:hypothetical protein